MFAKILSFCSQDIQKKPNSDINLCYKWAKKAAYNPIQNFVKFCQFVLKILCGNEISSQIKGHNSGTNVCKKICNNPNRLYKTKSAVFLYHKFSPFPRDPFSQTI